MKTYDSSQIREMINLDQDSEELIEDQKQAFIDFSLGLYDVPLPTHLHFPENNGDCHIKYGFRKNGDIFIIKVATGFYSNPGKGLPPSDGVFLVFSQKMGLLEAVLQDGGFLTTLRTSLAAAVATELTPWAVGKIGIIGTGQLGVMVLEVLKRMYPTAEFFLWGRSMEKARILAGDFAEVFPTVREVAAHSDLIITTTASTEPVLHRHHVNGRKHIIALGADDGKKQECDPGVFQIADQIIVDSIVQTSQLGDISHALKKDPSLSDKILELGTLLYRGTFAKGEIILTDLTGIAAQDVAIVETIVHKLQTALPRV